MFEPVYWEDENLTAEPPGKIPTLPPLAERGLLFRLSAELGVMLVLLLVPLG